MLMMMADGYTDDDQYILHAGAIVSQKCWIDFSVRFIWVLVANLVKVLAYQPYKLMRIRFQSDFGL